jgi:hypothetical protein
VDVVVVVVVVVDVVVVVVTQPALPLALPLSRAAFTSAAQRLMKGGTPGLSSILTLSLFLSSLLVILDYLLFRL